MHWRMMHWRMGDWSAALWTQSWQLAIVVVAVAGLAWWLGRRSPRIAYCLWAVVILKCLTPPWLALPTSVFSWVQPARVEWVGQERESDNRSAAGIASPHPAAADRSPAAAGSTGRAELRHMKSTDGTSPARDTTGARWRRWRRFRAIGSRDGCLMIWAIGAAATMIVCLGKWALGVRVLLGCRTADPDVEELTERIRARLGARRVRVVVSPRPVGPAVFGVWRPTILLPAKLLQPGADLEPILAHELAHIRRRDLWWAWLQSAAQMIWWFHPLVWWANTRMNCERERCCDETVIASLGYGRARYARCLVSVLEARRQRLPHGHPAVRSTEATMRRVTEILNRPNRCAYRSRWPAWLLAPALALLVLPGGALIDQRTQAADDTGRPSAARPSSTASQPAADRASKRAAKDKSAPARNSSRGWPAPRGDSRGSGSTPDAAPRRPRVLWKNSAPSSFDSGAVVEGDVVYVANSAGELRALSYKTGEVLWRVTIKGAAGPVTVVGGRIFVVDQAGRVLAVDARTGELLWTIKCAHEVTGAVNVAGDRVYLAAHDGVVVAADARTGEQVWRRELPDAVRGDVTVGKKIVAVSCCDGFLYALSPRDGATIWKYEIGPSDGTPVIQRRSVIGTGYEGVIAAVDSKTGEEVWRLTVDANARYSVAARGKSVLAAVGDSLLAVDAKTGERRWRAELRSRAAIDPIVVGDAVIVSCRDGRLHAFDLTDGQLRWSVEIGPEAIGRLAASRGRIIVVTDQRIYCLGDEQAKDGPVR